MTITGRNQVSPFAATVGIGVADACGVGEGTGVFVDVDVAVGEGVKTRKLASFTGTTTGALDVVFQKRKTE